MNEWTEKCYREQIEKQMDRGTKQEMNRKIKKQKSRRTEGRRDAEMMLQMNSGPECYNNKNSKR